MSGRIIIGDVRDKLAELPDESVHCVVTSPPYFGLRDYGVEGQIGLEADVSSYIESIVSVFGEVRRVLRNDGTLWLNLGDSYANSTGSQGIRTSISDDPSWHGGTLVNHPKRKQSVGSLRNAGLKPKDLCGIPWRVAFALQEDGWWLRQDIIWSKPNPMPESVTDRCTKAHEYLFLLSKSERYYFDQAAIAEPLGAASVARLSQPTLADQRGSDRVPGKTNGPMKAVGVRRPAGNKTHKGTAAYEAGEERFRTKAGLLDFAERERAKVAAGELLGTRNKRSVWEVATQPFSEAHFATFPPALIAPCILAGTSGKGCCSACGAPWVRQVERVDQGFNGSRYGERAVAANGGAITGGTARSTLGSSNGKLTGKTETIGWEHRCSCNAGLAPCIVLDPFGGAGTTGLVADRLGRNAILIELNPEYAEMAKRRIERDAGLFAEVA